MENSKVINSLKYLKSKKSYLRLQELNRFGFDPERVRLLPWFNPTQVTVGIHMDTEKVVGNQWVGWVLNQDGTVITHTFPDKHQANDWVIIKGERLIRRRKVKNQLLLYKLGGIVLILISLVIYLVIKLYT